VNFILRHHGGWLQTFDWVGLERIHGYLAEIFFELWLATLLDQSEARGISAKKLRIRSIA
jgi:hypothetical protein